MTDSTNRASKASLDNILAEFSLREATLAAFCARTKSLIEVSLQDAKIRYQSVQARVKTKVKLEKKYLDPTKNYTQLDDITDLAGLRVITYYEDELDLVAQVLEREFNIDRKDSADKRNTDPDRFGYRAINYVCRHLDKRITDVEYKQFAAIKCEIQITSILGHAWSEIEHEWYDLKEAYPDEVKRRFSIIAAIFELANREFVDIRRSRRDYERVITLQVEANIPNIPLDAVSIKSFIEQESIVVEIDKSIASVLSRPIANTLQDTTLESRTQAANFVGITELQELRAALTGFKEGIPEFVRRCRDEIWPQSAEGSYLSPGVCIYHLALILAGKLEEEQTLVLLAKLGIKNPTWNVARQVAIARDVLQKFSK